MSAPPPEEPAPAAAEAKRSAAHAAKAAPAVPKATRSERDLSASEGAAPAAGAAAAPHPEAKPAPEGLYSRQEATPLGNQSLSSRVAPMLKQLDTQPPEKWVERIQALRREGRLAEAGELLAELKRRYPAYPVPPELQ
jgi:hypothetical protein